MLIQEHFDAPTHLIFGWNLYIALTAVLANLIVTVGGSLVLNAIGLRSPSRVGERDYLPDGAAPAADPLELEPEASEPLAREPRLGGAQTGSPQRRTLA